MTRGSDCRHPPSFDTLAFVESVGQASCGGLKTRHFEEASKIGVQLAHNNLRLILLAQHFKHKWCYAGCISAVLRS